MMAHEEQRKAFIHELAEFLVANQVEYSIGLELKQREAQRWAKLRNAAPLYGYLTVEEGEKILTEFLLGGSK